MSAILISSNSMNVICQTITTIILIICINLPQGLGRADLYLLPKIFIRSNPLRLLQAKVPSRYCHHQTKVSELSLKIKRNEKCISRRLPFIGKAIKENTALKPLATSVVVQIRSKMRTARDWVPFIPFVIILPSLLQSQGITSHCPSTNKG